MIFKNTGADRAKLRRGRVTDNRDNAPGIEIIPPGGEPLCFLLPQDAEALVKELTRAWRTGAWRDLKISTKVMNLCEENDEDSGEWGP